LYNLANFFIYDLIRHMIMKKISPKQEGTIAIIAAILVLFSAMVDPKISLVISIVAFAAFGVWKFLEK